MPGWVVFVVIAVIVLTVVGWLLFDDSFVRIDPGHLGLVLYKGRATDRVLLPGPHIVPTFRSKMVQVYPSLELSYRAGARESADVPDSEYENGGRPLIAVLGDRSTVTISYTVRFRIDPERLKMVHERFGDLGIWASVRDRSDAAVRAGLCDAAIGVEDLFAPARPELVSKLGELVGQTLGDDGFVMVFFGIGDTDLGRTGEVIEAAARARYELAREEAEADTLLAKAHNDTELQKTLKGAPPDAAMRYREVDAWREVAQTLVERGGMVPAPIAHSSAAAVTARRRKPPADAQQAESDETVEQ